MLVKLQLLNLKGNPIDTTSLKQLLPKVRILSQSLEISQFSKYSSIEAKDVDLCELAAKEMLKTQKKPGAVGMSVSVAPQQQQQMQQEVVQLD